MLLYICFLFFGYVKKKRKSKFNMQIFAIFEFLKPININKIIIIKIIIKISFLKLIFFSRWLLFYSFTWYEKCRKEEKKEREKQKRSISIIYLAKKSCCFFFRVNFFFKVFFLRCQTRINSILVVWNIVRYIKLVNLE